MTITSKISYERKIEVCGTSEKAEGAMSSEVSSCRSRYKGTTYRMLSSIIRYFQKESLSQNNRWSFLPEMIVNCMGRVKVHALCCSLWPVKKIVVQFIKLLHFFF